MHCTVYMHDKTNLLEIRVGNWDEWPQCWRHLTSAERGPVVHKPITERASAAYKLDEHHLWSLLPPSSYFSPITGLWMAIVDKHVIREIAAMSTLTLQLSHTLLIVGLNDRKLVGCKPVEIFACSLKMCHSGLLNRRCILQRSWILSRNPCGLLEIHSFIHTVHTVFPKKYISRHKLKFP